MWKNVTGQKLKMFAFVPSTGLPKTGDAANLTAYVSKDHAAAVALGDTSATEVHATNEKGVYLWDLTQAETNADILSFSAKSTTADVSIVPILNLHTVPPNFSALSITSSTGLVTLADSSLTAAKIGADAITAAKVAADVSTEIVTAIFARAFSAAYNSRTFDEMIKVMYAAVIAGNVTGAGTASPVVRKPDNSGNAVTMTSDASGNRSSIVVTP